MVCVKRRVSKCIMLASTIFFDSIAQPAMNWWCAILILCSVPDSKPFLRTIKIFAKPCISRSIIIIILIRFIIFCSRIKTPNNKNQCAIILFQVLKFMALPIILKIRLLKYPYMLIYWLCIIYVIDFIYHFLIK